MWVLTRSVGTEYYLVYIIGISENYKWILYRYLIELAIFVTRYTGEDTLVSTLTAL